MKQPTNAEESANEWYHTSNYIGVRGAAIAAYLAGHAAGEAKAREEIDRLKKELSDLRSHMSLSIEMREGK